MYSTAGTSPLSTKRLARWCPSNRVVKPRTDVVTVVRFPTSLRPKWLQIG